MEKIIQDHELETYLRRCDTILDARSPKEFAEDHMPGSINVPVLDNQQRAEIGTLYRTDPFAARKRGAVYIMAAIQRFLQAERIQGASKNEAFLLYCARGGQRSGALSTPLSQIGFPVFRLKRGYKTYRSWVLRTISKELPAPLYVLHGFTGSRKTRILHALAEQVNVLDLEGFAHHRGSLLGDLPGLPQPGQRAFESAMVWAMRRLDPGKPTLVEGESRMIGTCQIPGELWQQMVAGRHLWLEVPREKRVLHILEEYGELKDETFLQPRLERLSRYLSHALISELTRHARLQQWPSFVEKLLEYHYDPLYQRSLASGGMTVFSAKGFDEAVAAVAAAMGLGLGVRDSRE